MLPRRCPFLDEALQFEKLCNIGIVVLDFALMDRSLVELDFPRAELGLCFQNGVLEIIDKSSGKNSNRKLMQ